VSDKPDTLQRAKLVAIYGFIGLVIVVVIADRVAPALFVGYAPLGDAALGLLLGAITALVVGEGITRVIKD
jgi:hypothetical protein